MNNFSPKLEPIHRTSQEKARQTFTLGTKLQKGISFSYEVSLILENISFSKDSSHDRKEINAKMFISDPCLL